MMILGFIFFSHCVLSVIVTIIVNIFVTIIGDVHYHFFSLTDIWP